jgi:hypothetical protein
MTLSQKLGHEMKTLTPAALYLWCGLACSSFSWDFSDELNNLTLTIFRLWLTPEDWKGVLQALHIND